MIQDLEAVFEELGLSQYLDIFVDQGFESWDIVLDITEDDLERLGVKLGHRRKLQRKIANWRGHQTGSTLTSPTKAEDGAGRHAGFRAGSQDSHADVSTKRKYRRHPKPDENAPERPPSAYVLFSNMMRDEMKGQNLTFIEIAKLVGERWQALPPTAKEPFETRALRAKEKYSRELAEYRKTPQYRHYSHYLLEFKAKQAANQDPPKRAKVDAAATGSSHATHGSSSSVSRVAARDADGLPTRRQRLGSNVSLADAQFAVVTTPPMPHNASMDDAMISPRSASHFEASESAIPFAGMTGGMPSQDARHRSASLRELPNPVVNPGSCRHQLPPLSDMILDERIPNTVPQAPLPDANGFGYAGRADPVFTSARDGPRIASLRHNSSSTASSDSNLGSAISMGTNSSTTSTTSSLSSSGGVPIHALLSSSTASPAPLQFPPKPSPPLPFVHRPTHGNTPPASEDGGFGASGERLAGGEANPSWPPAPTSFAQHPSATRYSMSQSVSPVSEPVRMVSTSPTCSAPNASLPDGMAATGSRIRGAGLGIERELERAAGLDGMSALLKAGEIVERATP